MSSHGEAAAERDRRHPPALLALTLLSLVVAALQVRDFRHPLIGTGDLGQWEPIGLLFGEMLRLWPLPHLTLWTDAAFYPYGVNPVYLSWCFERDLWYTLWSRAFGHGPWLQLYYTLSLLVGTLGAYLLLRRAFGVPRATLAAAGATLLHFYAQLQYPHHIQMAAAHWLVLNITLDFLLFRAVAHRRWPPLRLILLKPLLLCLMLGLDLSYIASFGLLSLAIFGVAAAAVALGRVVRERPAVREPVRAQLRAYAAEAARHRWTCAAVVLATLVAAWFYVPIAAHTAVEAATIPRAVAHAGPSDPVMFPLRPWLLAAPFLPLPGLDLEALGFPMAVIAPGASRVGWALLILGLAGLWGARRDVLPVLPLVLLVIAVYLHRPGWPVLHVLPWMSFTRVAERATIVLPIVFALLSLYVPWPSRPSVRRVAVAGVVALALAEFACGVVLPTWGRRTFVPDAAFHAYMRAIRETPGEAILDWPFAISAGNMVGQGFDRFGEQGWVGYAMRRFHGKKTLGHNFGRAQVPQLEGFMRAGWQPLLEAAATGRPLTDAQWRFFDAFFAVNDFAGIALYTNVLPPEMVPEVIARYGEPVAEATLPGGVHAAFIPKPAPLRKRVDPEAGVRVELDEPHTRTQFGLYLLNERRPREALRHLERALELEEDAHTHLNVAAALLALGRPDEAEPHVRYAMAHDGPPRAQVLLRELERQRAGD